MSCGVLKKSKTVRPRHRGLEALRKNHDYNDTIFIIPREAPKFPSADRSGKARHHRVSCDLSCFRGSVQGIPVNGSSPDDRDQAGDVNHGLFDHD